MLSDVTSSRVWIHLLWTFQWIRSLGCTGILVKETTLLVYNLSTFYVRKWDKRLKGNVPSWIVIIRCWWWWQSLWDRWWWRFSLWDRWWLLPLGDNGYLESVISLLHLFWSSESLSLSFSLPACIIRRMMSFVSHYDCYTVIMQSLSGCETSNLRLEALRVVQCLKWRLSRWNEAEFWKGKQCWNDEVLRDAILAVTADNAHVSRCATTLLNATLNSSLSSLSLFLHEPDVLRFFLAEHLWQHHHISTHASQIEPGFSHNNLKSVKTFQSAQIESPLKVSKFGDILIFDCT